jgi:hypothetical protein
MKKLLYPIGFALLCISLSFMGIYEGAGIPTGDSLAYLNCGKSLASKSEYSFPYYFLDNTFSLKFDFSEPNTVWPPLTSFILSLLLKLGLSVSIAVKFMIVFFAGTSIFFSWLFTNRILKSTYASNIVSLLIISTWAFRYWVQLSFMSESIYLTFTLGISLLIFEFFHKHTKRSIILLFILGIIISIPYYIKSAAPSFLLASLISVLFFGKSRKEKSISFLFISLGVFTGAIFWLLRNLSFNTIGSAGVGAIHNSFFISILELLRIFVPYHGAYFENKFTIVLAGAFLLLFSLLTFGIFCCNKNFITKLLNFFKSNLANPAFTISFFYCISFVVVTFFAMYVLPKASHFEMRYWMELIPFAYPIIWLTLRQLINSAETYFIIPFKTLGYLILFVVLLANVKEDYRNNSKSLNRLNTNHAQKRLKIGNLLKPYLPLRFYSNKNVKFETLTELTCWKFDYKSTYDPGFNGKYCFVKFKDSNIESLDLVKTDQSIPTGYKYIGTIDEVEYYIK